MTQPNAIPSAPMGNDTATPMPSAWVKLAELAAWITPAVMLSVPSGYSIGALLWLVCGMAAAGLAWKLRSRRHSIEAGRAPDWAGMVRRQTGASVALLLGVWLMEWGLNPAPTINTLDRPLKYVIALLAWPAIGVFLPRAAWVKWGIWIGALSAGAVAAWQVLVWNWSRAWGFTNAIQFGDLAVLLGIWSWLWAARQGGRWPIVGWLAGWVAFYAAIASQARGGWIMIAPLLLLAWLWTRDTASPHDSATTKKPRYAVVWRRVGIALAITAMLAIALPGRTDIAPRIRESWTQWNDFWQRHDADTSVGQRLAHWQLAWEAGWERPIFGWGDAGYQQEKSRRVDLGEHPSVLKQFGHAHNDWLDMWARRGITGVLGLALFFGVQFHVLSRLRRHQRLLADDPSLSTARREQARSGELAAVCGQLMIVGYIGFGQTQVMFAHNSGNLSYLFMLLTFLALATPGPASNQG